MHELLEAAARMRITEEMREGLDCARTILRVLGRVMDSGDMGELTYDRDSTYYLINEGMAALTNVLQKDEPLAPLPDRDAIIEECARECEKMGENEFEWAAEAIRALKEKP